MSRQAIDALSLVLSSSSTHRCSALLLGSLLLVCGVLLADVCSADVLVQPCFFLLLLCVLLLLLLVLCVCVSLCVSVCVSVTLSVMGSSVIVLSVCEGDASPMLSPIVRHCGGESVRP